MSAPHFVTYPPLNTTPKRYMLFCLFQVINLISKIITTFFCRLDQWALTRWKRLWTSTSRTHWTSEHTRETLVLCASLDWPRGPEIITWFPCWLLTPPEIIFPHDFQFNSHSIQFNSLSLSGHLWIPAINIHLHDCKLNPQIAADARDINRYLWFKFHLQRSSRLLFIPVMCCYQTYFLYS